MPRLSLSTLALLLAGSLSAGEDVDFRKEIWPVLQTRCVGCHGPEKQQGGLRLDSRPAMLKGGKTGKAVVPGNPAESVLIERITIKDDTERMPPKGERLTAGQVSAMTNWIRADAAWPKDFDAAKEMEKKPVSWAFQPVSKPNVPKSAFANPIDAFIAEKLSAGGLQMSPPADPRTFIRRITFDLTGLPPTPSEVAAFEKECAGKRQLPDEAVGKLVDRLLASPHYGERWARHWLDVVRFSESDGFEEDELRADAWTYRDYVIRAFNEDKPYFQFVREQIAGDVQHDYTAQSVAATGMLVAGPWDALQRVTPSKLGRLQSREEQLEEMVGAVSQTFMGVTLNCARCHHHKYDPIPQADYYRVKAVFEGVDHGLSPKYHAARRMLSEAEEAAWRKNTAPLRQRIAELDKAITETDKQLKEAKDKQLLQEKLAALRKDRETTNNELRTKFPVTMAFVGDREQPQPTVVFVRGDVKQPGEAVSPGGLSIIRQPAAEWGLDSTTPEQRRRIRFAEWLTHPDHPLTARVMVNRVWQGHFGTGIVEIASDFGANGSPPSHPELLDWLAGEFLRSNGSIKKLHRLIVTSAAYRQSSVNGAKEEAVAAVHQKAAGVDADNRLLWKFPARRLQGEEIRDAMLAMAGNLNREMGGPSFRPFTVTRLNTYFYHLKDSDEPAHNRRSIYRIQVITARSPLLDALDCPSPSVPIPKRRPTVTPLQALALMNDAFVLRQADLLAKQIAKDNSEVKQQVMRAFEIVFARLPREQEMAAAREVVEKHGLNTLTWSLFNSSEFLYAR
ncbi:PSD1 and planctomycete cytochrome C domain-containing protein [Zavarzinella formosa]|uniref:PSD1 and planctomycete cytochrome C domain-containing protein n=1 Tax=Zavarzinella formosa TaxID=360055 RepID=UPI000313BD0D|nr:PSD1 and planctomycete cytochrome C domain-containing protein [Zavarzinella formosa]